MIYRNAEVNGHNCSIAAFGQGDILCAVGTSEIGTFVSMKNINPLPIKAKVKIPDHTPIEEHKPELILSFTDPDSIDVVMIFLRAAKKELIKIKAKEATHEQ